MLKCVFVGVPITGLDGVPERVTPDGARMLAAFVHERVAAGRDVPAEVWIVIDKYPHAEEIAAIEAELESEFEDRRAAAAARVEPQNPGASMRIFDPHAHMTSRTTDDYEAMAASGVKVLVEPAFWLGQPRTSVGSFVDYFNSLLGWERFRAAQFGIRHHCTIGLNPKEANDDLLRREVIDILPRFLAKDGVVAVGEVGFDAMTPAEDEALTLAARARRRARAAGARAHAAPRQGGGHAQDDRARRGLGHRARDGRHRPQQRADRARGPGLGLLGGLLDLPGHEDGRAPDGARARGARAGAADRQLGLRLGRVATR